MSLLVAAFPGSEQIAAFAVKCLAVAGGFLAGYVIGGTGAWALDKWALAKKTPDVLKKTISFLTGVALALLIAFIVFGDGSGSGWLGGGSNGPGNNANNPDDGKKSDPNAPKPIDPKVQPKIDTQKTQPETDVLVVTFLGGEEVQGDRFYKLDGSEPMSFEQLKAAILKRKETARRPLKLEREFSTDPGKKISKDSINVRQVENWADGQGIKTP